MRLKGLLAIPVLLLIATGVQPALLAQEPSEPPTEQEAPQAEAPAEEPEQAPGEAPAEPVPGEEQPEKKKMPNGLWIYAAYGSASGKDVNSSIATSAESDSENTVTLDEWDYVRAEVGWKLPNEKGMFLARFNGYKETNYEFTGYGKQASLKPPLSATTILENLDWWDLSASNGSLTAVRTPPEWTLNDDANGDGAVSQDEVRYGDPDLAFTTPYFDSLQNKMSYVDLLYGRRFGKRKYSARWLVGLRTWEYKGNIIGGAWLNLSQPGEGYTDNTNLRVLNMNQDSSGWGPTGSLEADFNFLEGKLQFYVQGEAAFMLTTLNMDSGKFFSMVNTSTSPFVLVPIDARLTEQRDKSTWHTGAELGARYHMKNGLTFELAWSIDGYLDAILLPAQIQIPISATQAGQGTTAIYATHDIVLTGWRFGVGFQF